MSCGKQGLRDIVDFFEGLKTETRLSIKWDGAPAVVFGTHPQTNRFFVSTKSFFNKTSVAHYSPEEVTHESEVVKGLLQKCFALKDVVPVGSYYQGDVLFASDLDIEQIDNEPHFVTQENTIVYAVPVNSTTGHMWKTAKLGIAIHTEFTNSGRKIPVTEQFNSTKDVWVADVLTECKVSSAEYNELIEMTKDLIDVIWDTTVSNLNEHSDTYIRFVNAHVRSNLNINLDTVNESFTTFVDELYNIKAEKLKTQPSIDCLMKERQRFNEVDEDQLKLVFEVHNLFQQLKALTLKSVNLAESDVKCFIRTLDMKLEDTTHEGFVVINGNLSGCKLVDRQQFSYRNFTNETVKGWQRRR